VSNSVQIRSPRLDSINRPFVYQVEGLFPLQFPTISCEYSPAQSRGDFTGVFSGHRASLCHIEAFSGAIRREAWRFLMFRQLSAAARMRVT
jgi:hypothetical protein